MSRETGMFHLNRYVTTKCACSMMGDTIPLIELLTLDTGNTNVYSGIKIYTVSHTSDKSIYKRVKSSVTTSSVYSSPDS